MHGWYSIDDTDDDFDVFCRYLLTSLSNVDEKLEGIIGPTLQNQGRLSETDVIPLIIQGATSVDEAIYLVLDDYHFISENKIHQALNRLLRYLPPNLHLIIISRYPLPSSLRRFKYQHHTLEISPADLQLTVNEASDFFQKIFCIDLSSDQLNGAIQYTDGWIAGLHIIGLSLTQKDKIKGIKSVATSARNKIRDYLLIEVVNVQPEKVISFLYQTSVLKRFTTALAAYITEIDDAGEIIEDLRQKNLFLVSLDADWQWYQYHPLLSETIRERTAALKPELLTETLQKAARWFADHDYFEDALQHAFESRDFEFAADLIEENLKHLYERCERDSSHRWISELPQEILLKRPLLRLVQCAYNIDTMQLSDAWSVLSDIEHRQIDLIQQYETSKRQVCLDLLVSLKAAAHYHKDQFAVDIEHLDAAIQRISIEGKNFVGLIQILIAGTHAYHGEPELAEERLKKASKNLIPAKDATLKIEWAKIMSITVRYQGRLRQAEKIVEDAFLLLSRQKLNNSPLKFVLYRPQAEIFYQQGKLDDAYETGIIGLRYATHSKQFETIMTIHSQLILTCLAMGDFEKADRHRSRLQVAAKKANHPIWVRLSDALSLFVYLSLGNLNFMQNWVERRKLDFTEPFSWIFVVEVMVQAIFFQSQGCASESIELLENIRTRCARRNLKELILGIDMLYVAGLLMLGKMDEAKTILALALHFGEAEGYVQPFVSHAQIISPLLAEIINEQLPHRKSAYLTSLLASCHANPGASAIPPQGIEIQNRFNITKKEIEILRFMTAGYKNKEIADKHFISVNTVKTHVRNIYGKLDVTSRLQAIQKAKALNLVSGTDVL